MRAQGAHHLPRVSPAYWVLIFSSGPPSSSVQLPTNITDSAHSSGTTNPSLPTKQPLNHGGTTLCQRPISAIQPEGAEGQRNKGIFSVSRHKPRSSQSRAQDSVRSSAAEQSSELRLVQTPSSGTTSVGAASSLETLGRVGRRGKGQRRRRGSWDLGDA